MKFFSSILKHKKIATFAVLFFVFTAITIPQIAFAFWPFNWLDDAIGAVLNGLIYASMFIPLLLTAVLADIAGTLLKWALFISTSGISYTQSPAVGIGWPIIRDLANMMVVLGFVVVGIATTLRIQEYQAKKTLFPLIIAALLINFSLLICGIFIDASNIATNFFFSKIGNTFFAYENIKNSFAVLGNAFSDSWISFGPKLISMAVFNFLIFFIFLLYIVLILGRIVALWTLVILAPLAFVCYVFPATKSIWQMWWKNFSQWCIIGIPAGLFLYIGSQMMSGIIATEAPAFSSPSGILSQDTLTTLAGFASFFLPGLFLVIGFLVSLQFSAMGASTIMNFANKNKGAALRGGLGALSKASGKGGEIMGKLAGSGALAPGGSKYNPLTWAKATMRGAARMSEKGADVVTNYRATAQKTRSAFGRVLEGADAIPVGTQAQLDDKGLSDAIKTLTAALRSGNKKDEQRVFDNIHNGTGMSKAASISAAVSEGKLHEAFRRPDGTIDHSAMNDALVDAEKSGAPKNMRKDATDKYYQLAGFSDKNVDAALTSLGHKATIDAELTARGIAPGTATSTQRMTAARSVLSGVDISKAEGKANYTKLTQNWSNMDLEAKANTDLGGLHPNDLKEFTLNRNAEDIKVFKLLEAGHANRTTHKTTMLAYIIAELSTPGISTNRQRRLQEVRDELNKL